ncbi:solute carrier family 15 member 4-like [Babylonia areolata]|uniref:solute carrier family 15 member 4-like n=1 Tax=Babylonia areolata TaxID=304850 RepID=UPI003FD42AFF
MSNASERRRLLHPDPRVSRTRRQLSRQVSAPQSSVRFNSHDSRHLLFRTRAASAAILLSLILERAAFYGLAGNLVLFLNKNPLQWLSYNAMDTSLYFFGVSFVMSLIGGWLADAFLGRFKAILISFVIYVAGYVLMPLMASKGDTPGVRLLGLCSTNSSLNQNGTDTSTNPFAEDCAGLVLVALTVIAIGAGFVKANIAPFGSDQVAREGQQATLSFFNWFYWCVNLGALLGLSVITYIQQRMDFYLGYLISVCCLGLSTLLFVTGRCFYHVREPDGSVLTNIARIIREAFHRKRLRRQELAAWRRQRNRPSEVDSANSGEVSISFLDYAKHRHGGIFHDTLVEDVKQLKEVFAVFAALIPYWLVYFQMQTSFLVQGLHMRLSRPFALHTVDFNDSSMKPLQNSTSSADMAAAWLSLFDVVILFLLLPLFDRVIYPWLERRSGVPISISWRILLGMVFATLAMVVAGVVEHFRLEVFWNYNASSCVSHAIPQTIDDTIYHAADMSVLWQIPQYMLIGLSEVFTSVAGLQFAVSIAPRSMKGIIMGLFYLFSGIGSFLGTAIVAGLSSTKVWFHSRDFGNISCRICRKEGGRLTVTESCHLDYYFYLLAGIEVVGAALFLVVASVFQLDQHHRHCRVSYHMVTDDFLDPVNTRYQNRNQQGQTIQRLPSEEAGD